MHTPQKIVLVMASMLTGIWANAEKSDSIGEKMRVKELPGVEVNLHYS